MITRQIRDVKFDDSQYSDVNFLYANNMLSEQVINREMVYYEGKDDSMFPLTFSTLGQEGGYSSMEPMNDTQYTWDVMGRYKFTSRIVSLYSGSTTNVGIGYSEFFVVMEDGWFIKDYGAVTPDQETQVRIQSTGKKLGENQYLYKLVIMGGSRTSYIAASNFTAGKAWVLSAPTVAQTRSDGNRTNRMTPGTMTNQFGLFRYSFNIAGNIANKVTVYDFETEDGSTTKYWIPEEMRQFNHQMKVLNEDKLWFSEYNRDANGNITTFDDNGEPVPQGAGAREILTEAGGYSKYTKITPDLLMANLDRIWNNYVGETSPEITLYTGRGGRRMFHEGMYDEVKNEGLIYKLSMEEVKERGANTLEYGSYFQYYRTYDDKVFRTAQTNFFNRSPRALQDIENGRVYKGNPYLAYTLVFLDHSVGKSERNIKFVAEQGRELFSRIYPGMSPLPGAWGATDNKFISDRRDIASYEIMGSAGINISNPQTSLWLDLDVE